MYLESAAKMTEALRTRLRFVENVVGWEGSLSRKRVTEAFGISPNHVTNDLRLYRKMYPKNIEYDPSTRNYHPAEGFQYRIASGNPTEYLALLRTGSEADRNLVASLVGSTEICECIPEPKIPFDGSVLRSVTRAIIGRRGLKITYQSLRDPSPKVREVFPKALLFTGIRWYVRCFDVQKNDYRNFALTRITEISEDIRRNVVSPEDIDWVETEELRIIPNPKLSEQQTLIIAREYGMELIGDQWSWSPLVRKCLVPYMVNRYKLVAFGNPKEHPIVLSNYEKLKYLFFRTQEDIS